MVKLKGAIVVDSDRCKGCSLCVVACPKKCISIIWSLLFEWVFLCPLYILIISIVEKKVNVHGYPFVAPNSNAEDCIGCASCGMVCPDGCITVYKKKVEE